MSNEYNLSKNPEDGMNVFVLNLNSCRLKSSPDHRATTFKIEDNIGESIHIHYRNIRFELTIAEFLTLAENLDLAKNTLDEVHENNGD